MKKIQRHESASVSTPPSVGPIVGPIVAASPKSAWLKPSFAGGNASRMICCAGTIKPPPNAPCTKRNAISVGTSVAMPHSNEESVKPAIESAKYCLRPSSDESHGESGMMMTLAMI